MVLEQQVVVEVPVELSLPMFVVPELVQTKSGLVVEPELVRTKSGLVVELECPKLVLLGLGLGLGVDRTRFEPVDLVAKMGIVEGIAS